MLRPLVFSPYTAKELSATGWLRRQLEIQAAGLNGNLDRIYPDVMHSKWTGGDRPGWERFPYWLDGFIPLAWLLGDKELQRRADGYVTAILSCQKADGWLCPCEDTERAGYDLWAYFLVCKVLVLYYDCTGDGRIDEAVRRGLHRLNLHIESQTLKNWAASRWYECLIPLFWLYERKPEAWIEEMAYKLYLQGVNFEEMFNHWKYSAPHEKGRWSQMTHVVNLSMCLKSGALMSRLTGSDPNAFAQKAIHTLLRDHGMAVDHFTGDECLAGTSPLQGTELCAIVEAMYSYEHLISLTGDAGWADRLENLAYNALPATISPDMWSHQYDQMTNQVQCSSIPEEDKPFLTNSGESHIFGLQPNFCGCCTTNFGQGWPKFALSAFMRASDGIAITAIAPAVLKTTVEGAGVTVENHTNYPFEDGYSLSLSMDSPAVFTLYLRIPSHVESLAVNGEERPVPRDGWLPIRRLWSGEQVLSVSFGYQAKLIERPGDMYCVRRGPLLYSLPIEERWDMLEHNSNGLERKFPYCDYHIYPLSKWGYAFSDDQFSFKANQIGDIPFSPGKPPVSLYANMTEIDWPFEKGRCALKPSSTTPLTEPKSMMLIPYGCTNLRMTELPYAGKEA